MKKLFLASSFADVSELLQPFVKEDLKGKSVAFIPTASNTESYKNYVFADKKAFENLGMLPEELDISVASVDVIKNVLDRNEFIYVSGGNCFYLLQWLRISGAFSLILKAIEEGKAYIGASAGAVVMSPDIGYLQKMDDISKAPKLNAYQSFGLVDFHILPHYTNEPFKEIVEEIISDLAHLIPLKPLTNSQVILVNDDEVKVLGVS